MRTRGGDAGAGPGAIVLRGGWTAYYAAVYEMQIGIGGCDQVVDFADGVWGDCV